MKTLLSTLAAGAVATSALAQDAAPVAPAQNLFSDFMLTENVGVYAKKGSADSVAALNTLLGVKAAGIDWRVNAPVYVSDTSGYGSIELGAGWDAFKGLQFLGADTTINLDGGLWLPTGSADYFATNVNPHIGAGALLDWGTWSFEQTFDWRFITGGSMYDPLLDRFSSDLATLNSSVGYDLTESLQVAVDLGQYYFTDGGGTIMLSPNLKWAVASSVDVSAGIGFPLWQQLAVENNLVVNAGVSFKF